MNLDGRLTFSVRWDGARVQSVGIESTRAVGASRVLEGKAPGETAKLVPMLFSLCGRAQGVAALRAWEAAAEAEPAPTTALAREWVVAAEAFLESLWRLLLDWPEAMGEEAGQAQFVQWRRRLLDLAGALMRDEAWCAPGATVALRPREVHSAGAELCRFLDAEVLGMDPDAWSASDLAALEAWWNTGRSATARILRKLFEGQGLAGRSGVGLMEPDASEAPWRRVLERTLQEPGFATRPDWHGEPRETGALARIRDHPGVGEALIRHGNCIAVRVLARLADTVALARGLAGSGAAKRIHGIRIAPDTGAAWVETSRGVLAHALVIRDGRVARYRILAPTEWNFHPLGPFVQGLSGQEAASPQEVERTLRLHALALDPCVAYELTVGHA